MKSFIFILCVFISSYAFACQSKKDCTTGLICCKGTLWQDSGGFGSAGKSGACMTRNACYNEDGGINTLFDNDVECGAGAVLCIVTKSKGSIKGCFPKHMCD